MLRLETSHVSSRVTCHRLFDGDLVVSYGRFIELLARETEFRSYLTSVLVNSKFTAFRWETPPVSAANVDREFEFVLVNSPNLDRTASRTSFQQHFAKSNIPNDVLAFPNLGRNAQMIVPCPTENDQCYTHLASFLRGAPKEQIDRLWAVVGSEMQLATGDKPMWLSTAGGGVPWLHVRIDQFPKYYHHAAYKEFESPKK